MWRLQSSWIQLDPFVASMLLVEAAGSLCLHIQPDWWSLMYLRCASAALLLVSWFIMSQFVSAGSYTERICRLNVALGDGSSHGAEGAKSPSVGGRIVLNVSLI